MGLTELIEKHMPGYATLRAKHQLCIELAGSCSQYVEKLKPQIEQLEAEFNRNLEVAKKEVAVTPEEHLGVIFYGHTLIQLKLAKIHNEGDTFWYGLCAKFPLLLIFIKQSTLERNAGYLPK